MPRKTTRNNTEDTVQTLVPEVLPKEALDLVKTAVIQDIRTSISAYTKLLTTKVPAVITPDDKQAASLLLVKVREARERIYDFWYQSIKPIRTGLDALYAAHRHDSGPFEVLETKIKNSIADFDLSEKTRKAKEEEERRREIEKQRVEAANSRKLLEGLTNPVQRAMAEAKAEHAETRAIVLENRPSNTGPDKVVGSSTSFKPKPICVDLELFVAAVLTGEAPVEALMVDWVWVNQYFKEHPEKVAAWDGWEIEQTARVSVRA